MIFPFLNKNKQYLFLALPILLLSLIQPAVALFGVSLFLALLIVFSIRWLREMFDRYEFLPRTISILLISIVLFIPLFFITPFFNSLIALLESYFLVLLLFKASQKFYAYCKRRVERERYAPWSAALYFAAGIALLLNGRITLETLLQHPTGNIFLLIALLLGIGIIGTGMRFVASRAALRERKSINSRNILFLFFIFLFSFLSGATFESIVLLKVVSNAGLALFLFGVPLLRLWRQRRKLHHSMKEIVDSIYAE